MFSTEASGVAMRLVIFPVLGAVPCSMGPKVFEQRVRVSYDRSMRTAQKVSPVSVVDYLRSEENAKHRHEYVEGIIDAMVGAKNRHSVIAMNTSGNLHAQLRGKPCQAFNSDVKVRIRQSRGTRFYYPDAMVVCRPYPETDTFQDAPVVVVEVISESPRRTDETEKREGYLSIDSLCDCIRIEQSTQMANVDRRTDEGFTSERFSGDGVVPLPEVGIELHLAEVYEGVEFPFQEAEIIEESDL